MRKNLTPFERSLQEKMHHFELPYEPSAWGNLQRQMGMSKTGGFVWLVSLLSTVLALSGGAFALYRHQHSAATACKAFAGTHFENKIVNITRGVSHTYGINVQKNEVTSAASSHFLQPSINTLTSAEPSGFFNTSSGNLTESVNTANTLTAENTFQGPKPDNLIEFACNVRKACRGEEVEFQTTNGPKTGSYLWNFGDGHFSDQMNPKHKFAKAGDYDVSLSITSDNGQINTTVVNDMITIEDAPDADFTWEFVNTNPAAPEVRIINLSEGGNYFEWTNGNESTVLTDGAQFRLKDSGRQMIALNAKNSAGCSDGAVKHISVNSDFNLGADSQWSPADGYFMPSGLKKSKVDFVLSIFDNAGIKVFETSSRSKGWDGKLPGGAPAAYGSYSYKVIVTNDLTQEQKYFHGTFSVHP